MRPEEIDVNVNLWRQYYIEASDAVSAIQDTWDQGSIVDSIRHRTIHPEFCYFNIFDNARPIGFITGAVTQAAWNHEIFYGHVEYIYVLEEKRSMRVFQQLIDEFETWAKGFGATQITAGDIGINPERTRKLYQSIGFKEGCFMSKEIAE
jgi:GNAT superfamily N-acetyltransferase|tara:strand:+ start:7518 stop:7967 length:450 start_codon:yes stop_codon:yes gene_type:complete